MISSIQPTFKSNSTDSTNRFTKWLQKGDEACGWGSFPDFEGFL